MSTYVTTSFFHLSFGTHQSPFTTKIVTTNKRWRSLAAAITPAKPTESEKRSPFFLGGKEQ
ncbi:MAG: hypothetical protein F6K54_26625 [Okeania sp. SIO3B5]|uniref:hypothetical protein n=1 Tax=Okeania sp. SIO3B5 TaxID=2607811 RepID=UPI001400713C|nr:hypothetical protein [Okeania sp. SIO3B5]NEO56343.1 hypothetical protein [Okeania sp. SIO3B5]